MLVLLYTEDGFDDVGHFEILEPAGIAPLALHWAYQWVPSPECVAELNERAYWEELAAAAIQSGQMMVADLRDAFGCRPVANPGLGECFWHAIWDSTGVSPDIARRMVAAHAAAIAHPVTEEGVDFGQPTVSTTAGQVSAAVECFSHFLPSGLAVVHEPSHRVLVFRPFREAVSITPSGAVRQYLAICRFCFTRKMVLRTWVILRYWNRRR